MNNGIANVSTETIPFPSKIGDVTNEIKTFSSTTSHSETENEGRLFSFKIRDELQLLQLTFLKILATLYYIC